MKSVFNLKFSLTGVLLLALFGFQSCSKDAERIDIPEEAQLSQSELQAIMETGEYTGIVDDILAELFQNGKTDAAKFADDSCYQATYSETGFTVVFGNCVLNQTETVNGTLEVIYNKEAGSDSFTATYKSFSVGMAELNGTRTFTFTETVENSFEFTVQSDMTASLADGTILRESGTRTLLFQTGETLADFSFSISGNWVLSVDDTEYLVNVVSPVTGNLGCGYLVSGVMEISKNSLQVRVDFGDGSCDGAVTVIYPNGAAEELTL